MKRKKTVVVVGMGVVGLVLAVVATLLVVNRDAVVERFGEAVDAQTQRTSATLFRLGEVGSIRAELKSEYGTEPDVAYTTGTGSRVLSIVLSDYQLPEGVTAEDHAREIATFAIARTKKFKDIDVVDVLFQTAAGSSEAFSFALGELMSAPQADPANR